MEHFESLKNPVLMRLCGLSAVLAFLAATLLAIATPARGEATDVIPAATAVVADSPAAESSPPTPTPESPEVSTDATGAAPAEPVKPQVVTDAIESVATAVEDDPVARTAGKPPVSTSPPTRSSVATAVDSISTAATSADPARALPDVPTASATEHASRIVESTRQGAVKAIESVDRGSAAAIAPITQRLPLGPALPTLDLAGLLDSIGTTTAEALLPAIDALRPAVTARSEQLDVPATPQADLFFRWDAIASGGLIEQHLTLAELGKVESDGLAPNPPNGPSEARSPTLAGVNAVLSSAGSVNPFESPAPADIPPPAPGSPNAVASGLGGSLFVPLVALLALLALAVPATLRRFGEAADFRAPTPFTCALERPG